MNELEKKVKKYHSLTKKALEKVSIKKGLTATDRERAEKLLEMARAYFSDAVYFQEKRENALALAAFSYAHAWIDAGVRIGLLDGKNDDALFTLP